MYLVKHTPIRKNGKTYQVGSEYPYSDKDKSLLNKGYLEEAKDMSGVAKAKTDGPTEKKVEPNKKATIKKKPTVKKKK